MSCVLQVIDLPPSLRLIREVITRAVESQLPRSPEFEHNKSPSGYPQWVMSKGDNRFPLVVMTLQSPTIVVIETDDRDIFVAVEASLRVAFVRGKEKLSSDITIQLV